MTQNVWSPVYVDAMVLRDRDADLDDLTGDFGQPGSGLEERLYVQTDANFNVTSLVDTAGNVVERFLYDPYGTFTVHDANWTLDAGGSDFGWLHLHQGGRYDATTGLYHFRFRDYDPELGRWTRQDPAGYVDGGNLYNSYSTNPTALRDPDGLNPHTDRNEGGQPRVRNCTDLPIIVRADTPDSPGDNYAVVPPGGTSPHDWDTDYLWYNGRWFKVRPCLYTNWSDSPVEYQWQGISLIWPLNWTFQNINPVNRQTEWYPGKRANKDQAVPEDVKKEYEALGGTDRAKLESTQPYKHQYRGRRR